MDHPAADEAADLVLGDMLAGEDGDNAVFLQWKPVVATLKATITATSQGDKTIEVDDVTGFPASGNLVVNVNGEPLDSSDFGWKDTVVVPPGGEVTVAAQFTGYLGKYVFHCHNLEHEDYSMMSEFEVVAPV